MSSPQTQPVRGNQAGPVGVPRGGANWREDLIAYDALPGELRALLQSAPYELDAAAVLDGYRALCDRYGSDLMAIAMAAGHIDRFMRGVLASTVPTP